LIGFKSMTWRVELLDKARAFLKDLVSSHPHLFKGGLGRT